MPRRFERVEIGIFGAVGSTHHASGPLTDVARQATGTLFGMVSYAATRDSRLRLHPFLEYYDATGTRDSGVLLQRCMGCGWRK